MTEPAFRTPEQVARRTGLSRKAIYRAIERGDLTAYRLCGRLRIRTDDEDAWIDANRVHPAPAIELTADRPRPASGRHSLRRLTQRECGSETGLPGT